MTSAPMATSRTRSSELRAAIASFNTEDVRGYLAVAASGLPTRQTVEALQADLSGWWQARRNPMDYGPIQERTRGYYAAIVGIPVDWVAVGSQTSVMTSVLAAAVPAGAEVLCVDGDFSSIVFPFLQRNDIRVRSVPLDELASAIRDDTWLVSFSFAQSATGAIADISSIVAAARAHGAYTYCDTTQAVGVHPVDAAVFDATVCHAYKWLCCPRGVAFLTLRDEFAAVLSPIQAGWCAGQDIWQSCYGPEMHLSDSAKRFDVSSAWQAWVGAEPALHMFSGLDIAEVWAFTSGLGNQLCDALGMPKQHQAIVTWPDPQQVQVNRLLAAGVKVTGRAGRVRAAFHLWNDQSDVDRVVAALR